MTPERWQQVKDIFDSAVERDPASRIAFIRESCGSDDELRKEVESLLASDTETGSLFKNSLMERGSGAARGAAPRSLDGQSIGPYRVQREIGRGGMGVVYLASRADHAFHRLVAIKVVHVGLGSGEMLARFEQEREILAALDHPNIARLIDGGNTPDGLAYLVMEYVEGRAIDVYCDEHELNIPARLKLFRTVCAAVEHAHQKHIIHRDLKPANILVTASGTVKLLDFGIAKLMPGRDVESTVLITRTGLRLMTPEYASPEQIRGEAVGAATDVYALGVVLYELLTGHLPYRLRTAFSTRSFESSARSRPRARALLSPKLEMPERMRREAPNASAGRAGLPRPTCGDACRAISTALFSRRWKSSLTTGIARPPASAATSSSTSKAVRW